MSTMEKMEAAYKMIDSCDVAIMLDNNIEEYQNISTDDILFFKNRYYLKIF